MRERRAAVRERTLGVLQSKNPRACSVFLLQVDQNQRLDHRRVDVGTQVNDRAHAVEVLLPMP